MSEPYIGEIRMFAGNFAPSGWALCNGQELNISDYDALYALIGTTYGGNGQTTFALPDLRGRAAIHMGSGYNLGQNAGTETVTLTTQQIPVHAHPAYGSTADATLNSPSGAVWASVAAASYVTELTTGTQTTAMTPAITAQGGNQPHDNMMPFVTISYIIALQGVWPQQP